MGGIIRKKVSKNAHREVIMKKSLQNSGLDQPYFPEALYIVLQTKLGSITNDKEKHGC